MIMRKTILGLMLAAAALAHAADKPCSKADAASAEKAIDRVVTWQQLHKAWQDYRHCDADAVGDVFTDALLRLTVEWIEGPAGAVLQNNLQARHPIVCLAVD